jgi:hypothetical protein
LSALQTAAEELGFDSEGLSEEELTIAVESVLEKKLAKELAISCGIRGSIRNFV